MSSTQAQHGSPAQGSDARKWIPLSAVTEAGAYVVRGTGDLIRVTPTGLTADDDQAVEQQRENRVEVTMISRDPFIRITQARLAAANLDIEINF